MKSVASILLGSFFALQGCAPDAPLVMDGAGTALPYNIVVATGIRDGYYLTARIAFFAPDLTTSLQMQLRMEIDVVPKLRQGTWSLGSARGSISADWLEFFGGQGGSPIIAGRFRLQAAAPDSGSYVVTLPKTEIKRQGGG